jgi:hypothetical protein
LQPQNRNGAFTTPYPNDLIEVDGQLGYWIDGIFIAVCDLRPLRRRSMRRESDILKEFLEATPSLREQAKVILAL